MENFGTPKMAVSPPLPHSVYKQMAEQERYEALQQIADSAKSQAKSPERAYAR